MPLTFVESLDVRAVRLLTGAVGRYPSFDGLVAAAALMGALVGRPRPFARHDGVAALVDHAPHRSFPSRHVACAATMATVALPTAPLLGMVLGALGAVLAVSRVYAGLH